MMRAVVGVVAVVIACSSMVAVVRAAEGDPPCLEDTQRLCGLVPDTGSFVQGCLEQHRDELSADCRKHVGSMTGSDQKVRDACGSDTERFCGDVRLGGGQQLGCLVKHRESLSSRCRDTLDEESTKPAP